MGVKTAQANWSLRRNSQLERARNSHPASPRSAASNRQRDTEHEAQNAGVGEARRVAVNPPVVPGQNESGEADEAKCPGSRRQVPRRRQLAVHDEASEQEPRTRRAAVPMGPMSR